VVHRYQLHSYETGVYVSNSHHGCAKRYIVGWSLSNTLEKSVCLDLVEESIRKYGAPEIINSDQGVQFTNPSWIETLKEMVLK